MAALASPLLDMVLNKLGSEIWKEMGRLWGVGDDIEKLESILSTIRAVLDDAEKRSISETAVHDWLRKLKDAAYDADDVVDELQIEALRRRGHYHIIRKVRDFFSLNNPIVFRHNMALKVKRVRKRLDEIAKERKFHLTGGSDLIPESSHERETYSFVVESEVYGRDEDRETVIHFLMHTDNGKDVSILPIVGLGGVGKTTLAQLVYNDKRIESLFKLRIWVCVSEPFDVMAITRKIIECVPGQSCNPSNFESMQQQLRRILSEERFLLVLDDVWNDDEAEWGRLRTLLRGGKLGSKIIVTTRSDVVARIMGTVAKHQLKGLEANDCWILFKERAFGIGREEETPRLVEIGKEIVSKCGGLPLAAKALGSLMGSSRRGEAEWVAIRDSEIWKLPSEENKILPALMLSYDHLPSHVKQCFVFCSSFPKDYLLDKERLIGYWIAGGFIPTSDEGTHAEDTANRYFNSLLGRSFFQDVEKDEFGNIIACKMHDLVHDLACYVAGEVEFSIKNNSAEDQSVLPHGCRSLSLNCDDYFTPLNLRAAYEARKLRSVLLLMAWLEPLIEIISDIRGQPLFEIRWDMMPRHLRILDLSGRRIKKLPDTISRLKHLRLLDLSHCDDLETMPSSISSLQNLRTLNLKYCRRLRGLPHDISLLSSLRHLDISRCFSLTGMPRGMGRLTNLQTLSLFAVGNERGHTIADLQHLNLIGGRMEISGLQYVKDPTEAMQANLSAKTNLLSLTLRWSKWDAASRGNVEEEEDVLESLKPHPSLKSLEIEDYRGMRFPSWMEPSSSSLLWFPNLVEINLCDLKICESLPPLGRLPSLKCLYVSGMDAVRSMGRELYGDAGTFPALQSFNLDNMPNLEEWSMEATVTGGEMILMFPCLEYLDISKCPKLSRIQPCIPSSVVELGIYDSNKEVLSGRNLGGSFKLKELKIENCSVSSSSSGIWEGLQYLTALEELTISDCNLAMLPDVLQRLTALQQLRIIRCPLLEDRCARERGEDWHKIAHIPDINII